MPSSAIRSTLALALLMGGPTGCGDAAGRDVVDPTLDSSTTLQPTGPSTSPASASGDASTDAATADDGDTPSDSSTGDPACPWQPTFDRQWLTSYQRAVVGELSGADPLPGGTVLNERSSAGGRIEARAYLTGRLVEAGLQPEAHSYGSGANVFARIPATTPSAVNLVVGAHYDTVPGSPGANDNATGVAMVLALGHMIASLPCRNATVMIVFFDEEEVGLVGSDAFAQYLVEQALSVESVHTIDQMGWDDDGDHAIELERPSNGLIAFYEAAVAELGNDAPLTVTSTGFTDHVSFRDYGFAAIGLSEEFASGDTTPHYHLPSDTFATVNFEYLASSTEVAAAAFGLRLVDPG